ncbi:MAG: PASTA domain-containing protein [Thermacetogeniaceae bacterium]
MDKQEDVPDVIGFTLDEAKQILQRAGLCVRIKSTSSHTGNRARVLRQRVIGNGEVELTISYEYYKDPAME